MEQKGGTFFIMENSFTATMVSWKTGTKFLGGCNHRKVWQAYGNSNKESGGGGACPQKKVLR